MKIFEYVEYNIYRRIQAELSRIEAEKGVKIIYACESGSRAWGFPSQNSDYDVRFIYVHQIESYLTIDNSMRDTIEEIKHDLDFSGWDIRKALRLFRGGNPSLIEWLHSPIVYYDQFDLVDTLRQLTQRCFKRKGSIYHYLHMAENNWKKHLQGKDGLVWVKKYLYVLRPILVCQWIASWQRRPPVEFMVLRNHIPEMYAERYTSTYVSGLLDAIDDLLDRKMAGEELDRASTIPILHDFLAKELEYFEKWLKGESKTSQQDTTPELDVIFRETLNKARLLKISCAVNLSAKEME